MEEEDDGERKAGEVKRRPFDSRCREEKRILLGGEWAAGAGALVLQVSCSPAILQEEAHLSNLFVTVL